ncbi:MAG: YegS/Rv2252/BmrU family lipid kinase, partial [Clostridia bacterium]|nr:YegS/Rv2252/BmrU family lipid kinase [Clostridia bacterium]
DYDRLICSGGDGTLSEVVNGVINSGHNIPIGYIPCGTTNDFADTLGLGTNIKKAAEFAAGGEPVVCDVGSFNGKFFTYTAAFGLFSEVAYITPQSIKSVIGRAAYLLNGAESMIEAKPQHLRVSFNGEVIEEDFLFGMISNSKSIGGFKGIGGISVELSDGLFETVLVKMPKNVNDMQLIMRAFMQKDLRPEFGVYSVKSSNITVEAFGETTWTLDGDYGGAPSKVEISVLKEAVSYIAKI